MLPRDLPARIEAAAADLFWLPPDVRCVRRPEITYCASHRPDILYNTVTTTHPTSTPQARRLAFEVHRAHLRRPSRWCLNPTAERLLAFDLTRCGYQPWRTCQLRAAPTLDLLHQPLPPLLPTPYPVHTLDDLHDWHRANRAAFLKADDAPLPSPDTLAHELRLCTGDAPRVLRLLTRTPDGQPAAAAALTLCPDLGVAFLWAGGTDPQHRHQGAYTALLHARALHAAQRRIPWLALFALPETSAPIVQRRGFTQCGQMSFWDR